VQKWTSSSLCNEVNTHVMLLLGAASLRNAYGKTRYQGKNNNSLTVELIDFESLDGHRD
jgi:hypothetical protein